MSLSNRDLGIVRRQNTDALGPIDPEVATDLGYESTEAFRAMLDGRSEVSLLSEVVEVEPVPTPSRSAAPPSQRTGRPPQGIHDFVSEYNAWLEQHPGTKI